LTPESNFSSWSGELVDTWPSNATDADVLTNASFWHICTGVAAPCNLDGIVSKNGQDCLLRERRVGWNQLQACTPSSFEEIFWRYAAAVTEMSLTFSIFSRLLLVLKGFCLRLVFMGYLTTVVAWPGMHSYRRTHNTYGLLPQFELDHTENIVSYNRIRVYLQTFEADEFNHEQQQV
jgi:hypothetical protein